MKKIVIIFTSIILILALGVGIYIGDYYHADEVALNCITDETDDITVIEKDGNYIFSSAEPTVGLIFYPGGKVEAESYAPLMVKLAEQNILVILVSMPARLAVLGIDKADGLCEEYPDIQEWYMAGHSLGGSMAAKYVSEHDSEYEGLILLAAYSTESLNNKNLKVLSVYGDCDKVLNMESYKENLCNLPEGYTEVIIKGGCHAYFGSYGAQSGDGEPSITREEQYNRTIEAIVEFIQ